MPVAGRGQASGDVRGGPGGVVAQLPGEHPGRQRQAAAQACDLAHGSVGGADPGPGRQPGQQGRRLAGSQRAVTRNLQR